MTTYHSDKTPNGATIELNEDTLRDGELRLSIRSGNLTVRADLTEDAATRLATALNHFYFSKHYDTTWIAADDDVAADLTPSGREDGRHLTSRGLVYSWPV